jgi:hypothetical protein
MRAPLELLYNFHWVLPGEAARSAQAFAGFLSPLLTANGIRGLINLRGHHPYFAWWRYEQRVCERHGIATFDAMLDSGKLPTPKMLVSLLDAFDASPRPFLMKCSGGQDRTSLAAALYIVHRKGWAARDEAQRQFRAVPYLHLPKPHQKWLRQLLPFAEERATGQSLSAFLRERYDPQDFAEWLSARGLSGSFREIFLPRNERIRVN